MTRKKAETIDHEKKNQKAQEVIDSLEEDIEIEDYTEEPEGEESLSKYRMAPEIHENYVSRIVNNHRPDLAQARIVTMFRRGNWSSKQKDTWAATKRISREIATLMGGEGGDYLITVNQDIWENLNEAQRIALIDHELCHCLRGDDDKHGNPKWQTVGHDIEEFFAIIKRHGDWSEDVKRALRAFEESKQVSMFDPFRAKQQEEDAQRKHDFTEAFPDASGQ